MDGFTLRRVWRGATYEIVVENPDHLEKGGQSYDRGRQAGKQQHSLPVPAGSTVEVKIVMVDRRLYRKQRPQWLLLFCTVLYTGVLLREPETPYPAARAAE